MADLYRQLEINKLARVLAVDPGSLSALLASEAADIQAFRKVVTTRLFSRHAARVSALATLSKKVPVAISAKIAEGAFGPVLSARIAGALDPADAAKLATLLSPDFLTDVARDVDPSRVAPIIKLLPEHTIVTVGHMLLAAGDTVTLARFVASVSAETALAVVAGADARQLLELALYVDEPAALDPLISELSDQRIAGILATADGFAGVDPEQIAQAVAELVASLSPSTRARWADIAGTTPTAAAKAITASLAP